MRKGGPGVSQVRRVKIVPPVLEDKEVTGVEGREGGVLGAISTYPTKTTEALQDLVVKEAGTGRVSQGLIQEVVDEVDAWLHGEHHAWFQVPGGAQATQAGLVNPVHTLGGVVRGEGSEGVPRRAQPQARATTSRVGRQKRASVQGIRPSVQASIYTWGLAPAPWVPLESQEAL